MAINIHLLGKKIQQLRKERKISQIRFAEMIETSSTFVSCLERGVKSPSLETLVAIADVLDTSMDNLLAESRKAPTRESGNDISSLLQGCSGYERFVILQNMKELKRILRDGETIRSEIPRVNG